MNRKLKKQLEELKTRSLKISSESLEHAIDRILKNKNINAQEEYEGSTFLIDAAYCGDTELVKLLIEYGADISIKNEHGWTALTFAVQNRHVETAKFLIDNYGLKSTSVYDLIKRAVNNNDFEMIKMLFNVVKTDDHILCDFIFYAVKANIDMKEKLKIVKFLLDNKMNPNMTDFSNTTLLVATIENNINGLELVKLLLDYGANPNLCHFFHTPPLVTSALKNYQDIIKLLLEKGANVDAIDINEDTALMIAVRNNNLELIKLLLEKGANINETYQRDETILYEVVRMENLEIAKFLLEYSESNAPILKNNPYGANPNVVNCLGSTPLYFAVNQENIEMIELLISHGAYPDNESIALAFKKNRTDIGLLLVNYLLNIEGKEEIQTKKLIK